MDDVVELYRLEATVSKDHIIHRVFSGDSLDEQVEQWRTVDRIGSGAAGEVRSEVEEATGRMRAVKVVNKAWLRGKMDYRRELLAMGILSKYPHAFVNFYGWFEDKDELFIAMELILNGDLRRYLDEKGIRPESEGKVFAFQIFRGLEIMHQCHFTHRDLKPQNIFIASLSPLWIKIGDFGISKRVRGPTTELNTRAYTPGYAAPEVLLSLTASYTNKVDIWSSGCILHEILTSSRPDPMALYDLNNDSTLSENIPVVYELRRVGVTSEGIRFIMSLLKWVPNERPTATEAKNHTWTRSWNEEDSQEHTTQINPVQTGPVTGTVLKTGTQYPDESKNPSQSSINFMSMHNEPSSRDPDESQMISRVEGKRPPPKWESLVARIPPIPHAQLLKDLDGAASNTIFTSSDSKTIDINDESQVGKASHNRLPMIVPFPPNPPGVFPPTGEYAWSLNPSFDLNFLTSSDFATIPEYLYQPINVAMFGDAACGKSRLAIRMARSTYDTTSSPPKIYSYPYRVKRLPSNISMACHVTISDYTAINSHYQSRKRHTYYRMNNCELALLCFSLDDWKSCVNCRKVWLPDIQKCLPNARLIIVGCKMDRRPQLYQILQGLLPREQDIVHIPKPVSFAEGLEMARICGAELYAEASAQDNLGIDELSWSLAATALYYRWRKGNEEGSKGCSLM